MKCPRHIDETVVDTLDRGRVCLKCQTEPKGPTPLDIEWEERKARERKRYADLKARGWR